MKDWPSAADLVALAVEGLPRTKKGMLKLTASLGAASVEVVVRGGKQLRFDPRDLPRPLAQAWARRLMAALPAPVPQVAAPSLPSLRDHQRRRLEARLVLLAELERRAETMGLNQAVAAMVDLAARGELPPHLQPLVPIANARVGDERALSRRSLLRWREEKKRGAAALAPRDGRETAPPQWGAALIAAFARPQKPSLQSALAALQLPPGIAAPSYHQARRFLARMSVIEKNRGRMGPRALKSLRAFTRRDLAALGPLDLGLMDGHSFDAEVAHPIHGQPFRPEVTTVIDAKTRKVIGWSVALAESQHAVMDALRHAAVTHGALAILYVDRGSGYEGDIISAPGIGLLARLGTRHETSLPYNSQARGLIERLHQSLWVRAAKELATYIGAAMDAEAKKKVHVLTRRDLEARRRLLMPWRDFLEFAHNQVQAYNQRPHRALPKIDGRNMSPAEAYDAALAKGFEPTLISADEAADLFRPAREAVTRRGEVVLFGNIYFARALEHRSGERVTVAYDIHDPSRVWVKDGDGRLLAEATLDGNKRGFFPQSVVEQAREQRVAAKVVRLERHLATARAELAPPSIEAEAAPLDPALEALADAKLQALAPPPAAAEPISSGDRPVFASDEQFARWCLAHEALMTDGDRVYLAELMRSASFRALVGVASGEQGTAG